MDSTRSGKRQRGIIIFFFSLPPAERITLFLFFSRFLEPKKDETKTREEKKKKREKQRKKQRTEGTKWRSAPSGCIRHNGGSRASAPAGETAHYSLNPPDLRAALLAVIQVASSHPLAFKQPDKPHIPAINTIELFGLSLGGWQLTGLIHSSHGRPRAGVLNPDAEAIEDVFSIRRYGAGGRCAPGWEDARRR